MDSIDNKPKRYTEYSGKIENPADAIRLVSVGILLAPFRLVNEYTKKIMFIDRAAAKTQLLFAMGLNALLVIAEIVYVFIRRKTIVILETNIVPGIVSLVIIFVFYMALCRLKSFDLQEVSEDPNPYVEEDPNPDIELENMEESEDTQIESEPEPNPVSFEDLYEKSDFGEPGVLSDEMLDFSESMYNLKEELMKSSGEIKQVLDDSVENNYFDLDCNGWNDMPNGDEMLESMADILEGGNF